MSVQIEPVYAWGDYPRKKYSAEEKIRIVYGRQLRIRHTG
jgi:hypothetical protein